MRLELSEVILFHPYPVAHGTAYRCFDGLEWHDCDAYGQILRRKK